MSHCTVGATGGRKLHSGLACTSGPHQPRQDILEVFSREHTPELRNRCGQGYAPRIEKLVAQLNKVGTSPTGSARCAFHPIGTRTELSMFMPAPLAQAGATSPRRMTPM